MSDCATCSSLPGGMLDWSELPAGWHSVDTAPWISPRDWRTVRECGECAALWYLEYDVRDRYLRSIDALPPEAGWLLRPDGGFKRIKRFVADGDASTDWLLEAWLGNAPRGASGQVVLRLGQELKGQLRDREQTLRYLRLLKAALGNPASGPEAGDKLDPAIIARVVERHPGDAAILEPARAIASRPGAAEGSAPAWSRVEAGIETDPRVRHRQLIDAAGRSNPRDAVEQLRAAVDSLREQAWRPPSGLDRSEVEALVKGYRQLTTLRARARDDVQRSQIGAVCDGYLALLKDVAAHGLASPGGLAVARRALARSGAGGR